MQPTPSALKKPRTMITTYDNARSAMTMAVGQLSPVATDPIRDLVADFFAGQKASTLASYKQSLMDFAHFLGTDDVAQAAGALLAHGPGRANKLVYRYRSYLQERGMSASTCNNRLSATRSLIKLARIIGIVTWGLEVPNLKTENYRDCRGPTTDAVRQLLDRAGAHRCAVHAARDVAMLRLLYDLALRRGSITSLDVEHLNLDEGTIEVKVKGKTGRVRRSLPDQTKQALQHWLRYRGDYSGAVFVSFDRSRKGGRLTGRSVHRIIARLGADVGIVARPHGLRHAAITTALDATNGNIRSVAKFSGHSDVRVIERYDDARQDLDGQVARQVAASI
jgi:integrase/recombinase XerC